MVSSFSTNNRVLGTSWDKRCIEPGVGKIDTGTDPYYRGYAGIEPGISSLVHTPVHCPLAGNLPVRPPVRNTSNRTVMFKGLSDSHENLHQLRLPLRTVPDSIHGLNTEPTQRIKITSLLRRTLRPG